MIKFTSQLKKLSYVSFCTVLLLSTSTIQCTMPGSISVPWEKLKAESTQGKVECGIEVAALVAEIASILQMGTNNQNFIKLTAALNGLIHGSKVAKNGYRLYQCRWPHPITTIVDIFFTFKDLRKFEDADKIAEYNKTMKCKVLKQKILQCIWLAINYGLRLGKYSSDDDSLSGDFLIDLLTGISEFFRKKLRYSTEFGKYQQFYEVQETQNKSQSK